MVYNSKISIIVPIYNVEKYLRKCIDSILNQSYDNLQIILVDDGSPDNCPKICDEYLNKDNRIQVIHKSNGGLSSARNAGIKVANGKYIAFIDSDDYIELNMIEKLVNAIEKSNADLCICGIRWVNKDGTLFTKVAKSPIKNIVYDDDKKFDLFIQANYFYYVTAVNKLYKKSLFDSILFPEQKINEDEFTAHHIFNCCNRICCIEDELYNYVQADTSIMRSEFSIKRLDGVEAFLDRALFFKNKKMREHYVFCTRQAYGLMYTCLQRLDVYKNRKIIHPLFKKVYKYLKFDLRRIKLYLAYYPKLIKGAIKYFLYKSYLRENFKTKNDSRIVLLATPQHGNLGDQAIVFAEYQILNKIFPKQKVVEIPNECYIRFPELCKRYIRKQDLIIIDGGGNLGSIWKKEDDKISNIIQDFRDNKIVIFPQTCFYEKDDVKRIERNFNIYKQTKRLSVMLRDKKSFDLFNSLFPEISSYFVPDIVLSLNLNSSVFQQKRNGVLLCFRDDSEKVFSNDKRTTIEQILKQNNLNFSNTSTVIFNGVSQKNRKKELKKKWKEFSSAQLVITDRLHAMIFSAITQTPCIAFDNVSKKVSGVYNWIDKLEYIKCIDDIDNIDGIIKDLIHVNNANYTFVYPVDEVESILKK